MADGNTDLLYNLETSLYEKAMGKCKKITSIKHYIFDENGKRILDSEDIKEESGVPDTGALCFALINLSANRTDGGIIFRQKHDIQLNDSDDIVKNFKGFAEQMKKISKKDMEAVKDDDPLV